MSPLTVLFNTYPVAFDCPGGGEVQLLNYREALEAAGVRVLLYDVWHAREQLDAADIVHYFSVQGGSWRFCGHIRDVRKLPLVLSPIIWIDDPRKYGLDDIGATLRLAHRVLPNSRAECEQLAGVFGMDRTLFSPIVNGVDDVFFETADPALFRERFAVPEPFVLCMGNIEERKNQLRLIQALAGTGLRLVLAGQEREADYAARCREVAGDDVHFVGRLEHGSALQRAAYAAAEVVVLASTLETPGLAALEAAAAGARLAVTREGCAEEYFGDFAVYLDPNRPESIRDAVIAARGRPKDPDLPGFIRERYTWTRAAEQLLAVYRSLVGGGHA